MPPRSKQPQALPRADLATPTHRTRSSIADRPTSQRHQRTPGAGSSRSSFPRRRNLFPYATEEGDPMTDMPPPGDRPEPEAPAPGPAAPEPPTEPEVPSVAPPSNAEPTVPQWTSADAAPAAPVLRRHPRRLDHGDLSCCRRAGHGCSGRATTSTRAGRPSPGGRGAVCSLAASTDRPAPDTGGPGRPRPLLRRHRDARRGAAHRRHPARHHRRLHLRRRRPRSCPARTSTRFRPVSQRPRRP